MRGIEEWLEGPGLGEYASRFVENGVDLGALRDITEQDLKELGVLLGHRRRLLRAIAELSRPAALAARVQPEPVSVVTGSQERAGTSEAAGERRYLTVLFCDLADSTGIASRLDAEEWRDLIGGYLESASAAVTAIGIGINYGPAVLGNVGGAQSMAFTVIGDMVNTASRLQQLTRTLQTPLVVGEPLAAALRNGSPRGAGALLEQLRDGGEQTLRGRAGSIHIWTR